MELCPQDRWLLLATDGVWEFIDCQVGSERSGRLVKVQLPVLRTAMQSQHCCAWQYRRTALSAPSPAASQLPVLVSPATGHELSLAPLPCSFCRCSWPLIL